MSEKDSTLARLEEQEKERRLKRLQDLEDQIFYKAAGVVDAHASFFEVSKDQETPPSEWVEKYGALGAAQRLAVAKTGWEKKADCPSGVDLAGKFLIGSMRARATRSGKQVQQNLNVKINLPAPTSKDHPTLEAEAYPVKEIEDG
jgi:hypothetical protein